MVTIECTHSDGGMDYMTVLHVCGVPEVCADVSIAIEMGTLMTGFIGPIPSGCLIILKI